MLRKVVTRVVLILIALIIVTALLGEVSVAASNVGRTAADFLQIGNGARSAGMGGAFTAMAEGASAAYWNPAGLSRTEDFEVSFGHFAWYQDITVEQAGMAWPLPSGQVIGASLTYVNYGQIDGYDASGNATGDLTAYDLAGGLSFGMPLNDIWSIGVTAKVISQRLDEYSATGVAGDLGLKYTGGSFAVAATVTNVGSAMKFNEVSEKLPSAFHLGVAVFPFEGAFATSLDVEKRFFGDLLIHQGIEVGFEDRYFLRSGYDYLAAQDGRSLSTGLSVGAGLRLDWAEFDYSFTPNDKTTSEDLHRFTLSLKLER